MPPRLITSWIEIKKLQSWLWLKSVLTVKYLVCLMLPGSKHASALILWSWLEKCFTQYIHTNLDTEWSKKKQKQSTVLPTIKQFPEANTPRNFIFIPMVCGSTYGLLNPFGSQMWNMQKMTPELTNVGKKKRRSRECYSYFSPHATIPLLSALARIFKRWTSPNLNNFFLHQLLSWQNFPSLQLLCYFHKYTHTHNTNNHLHFRSILFQVRINSGAQLPWQL